MTERLWLGKDGKYSVFASYVCLFQDKKVKLRKPGGALIAVPLNILCDADIAYITTQSKSPTEGSNTGLPPTVSLNSSSESLSIEAMPSIIQHMSTEDMIPKRSLSTITDQFKRHTFFQDTQHDSRNFANLPSKVLSHIASLLDLPSRLAFSTVTKRCRRIVFEPTIWNSIYFLPTDHYRINDIFMNRLVRYLRSKHLQEAVEHVKLDSTAVTFKSIVLLVQVLHHLKSLSLKSCWQVMTFELAVALTELVQQRITTSLSKVTLGKVLHRGTVSPAIIDSKSFGQDVWHINTALNKLAGRPVYVDITLCSTCQLGASTHEFYCSCCGFLPIKKCITCAPKCDRCGVQTCGLNTCLDPKLKVQLTKCGRCEQLLALCNNEKSEPCRRARQPCPQCHRLYHVKCRTADGYKSNQCSKCGTAACPHCELVSCHGGCLGQWCKMCAPSLKYCKCIVIQGKTTKSLSKRCVCNKCHKTCPQCDAPHFCKRCLKVHLIKCGK